MRPLHFSSFCDSKSLLLLKFLVEFVLYLTWSRGVSIDLSVFRFIAEEWSPCSVTCGEGVKHREVRCKIFLEFSQTIAKLPDSQCSGPKPVETEKCTMEPCGLLENSLPYRIDTVGDSGYAESSLTDSYSRSSSGSSGGSGYDSGIKVAPGDDVQTTYSWKETGYTPCSATCLGGNGLDDHCSPRLLLIIYRTDSQRGWALLLEPSGISDYQSVTHAGF